MSRENLANLLDELADRIEGGDKSFALQVPLTQAAQALAILEHRQGAQLLVQIMTLLLHQRPRSSANSAIEDYLKRHTAHLKPLDPPKDAAAMRELANEIRSEK